MSNVGLKNNTKQLEKKVDGSFDTYVNLSKQDANLIAVIPFININARYVFDINLIYNHQDRNVDDGLLGYGFRFSFYTRVDYISSTRYKITSADGSSYYYDYESTTQTYKNNKTLKELSVSGPQGSRIYAITDKYGNIVEVKENISNPYPSKITYADGKEITFIYYQNPYRLYKIQLGTYITIEFSSLPINRVDYNYGGYLSTYAIAYSNNRIIQFNNALKKGQLVVDSNTKIINIEYDNTASICFIDALKKEKLKFEFGNGYVFLIKEYKYAISESFTYSTINYIDNNKTTISNFYGDNVSYYFNNDGLPLFEKDQDNNIIYYNYNDNELLTHISSNIGCYPRKSGYLDTNIDSTYTLTGSVDGTIGTDSGEFSNILASQICNLTGTGTAIKKLQVIL